MKLKSVLAAGWLVSSSLLATAQAATLQPDGFWAAFNVDGNLPPYSLAWVDDNAAPLAFNITIGAGQQGSLRVVDAGFSGDAYTVFDNGTSLGSTSVPVPGDVNGAIEFDFNTAWANSNFSRGSFTLQAGTHVITGLMSLSLADANGPLNASFGGVRLDVSPVPEPASVATLLAGLALMTVWLRRAAK